MREKVLGPESLWERTWPPVCHIGWVVAGFCFFFRVSLSYSLWRAPSPLSPQLLLSSRTLATQPSLAACILGDQTPAVQTQIVKPRAECFQCPPPPPALCHEGSVHFLEPSLLAEAQLEGAAALVTWKINYDHKYPKEGSMPRKWLQRAPFRSALGVGPLPATSSPNSKEVQVG